VTGRRSNQLSYAPAVCFGVKAAPSASQAERTAAGHSHIPFTSNRGAIHVSKVERNRGAAAVFAARGARNPQFFDIDHEKTLNFRDKSMVRPAPNRLCDECLWGFFPYSTNEEVEQMAKAVAGKQATVTMRNLAAKLAEDHELSKKQTESILGGMVELVTKHLKKGDRIRIGGLGILQVRKRAARMGRNPATGEPIQIKASKKVAFRAAKELKESV
jgi:DNA-binding protein HU-beta